MEFIRKLSTYTFFTLIERSINFILLPILTHYLIPEEFGKVALFQTFLIVLQPIILLNMNGAATVSFFKRSKSEFPILVGNIFNILLVSSTILFLILAILSSYIYSQFHFSFLLIVLMVVLCFTESVKAIVMALLQCQKKAFNFGLFSICFTLLNILITLLFFNIMQPSGALRIYAIFYASLLSSATCIIYLLWNNLIKFSISKKEMIDLIKFGAPLIVHSYVFIVVSSADRFFIKEYYGDAILGIYATGAAVSSINSAIYTSINNAWVPFLYEFLKENTLESVNKINKFTQRFLYLLIGILILYIIGCYLLYNFIIDIKYYDSLPVSIICGVGFFVSFFYNINANILFFYKKTHIFLKVGLIVIAFNLIMNYFFIKSFSIIGAAIVYGLTYICFASLIYIHSSKIFKYRLLHKYS